MEISEAIAKAALIAFGCFCVVYSVITILFYWRQHCKSSDFSLSETAEPWTYLQPSWWWKIKDKFFNRKTTKSATGKTLRLPFKVPYQYEMFIENDYNKREDAYGLKIKCPDLKVQFGAHMQVGPRSDGTWGYTSFELTNVANISWIKDNIHPAGEDLLPYGTSLFEVDRRAKEIVEFFTKQRINSQLGGFFQSEWQDWIKKVDNFEAMKGHSEKYKK